MDTSGDPWASFNSAQNTTFDQKLADAKENELNNVNNDTTNDTSNNNDSSNNYNNNGNNNSNSNTNYNNNNNNSSNYSNNNNNNMGNMGNMGNNMGNNMGGMGNPYYGGGGNPYYGGGGGYSDPNATMGSADNANPSGDYSNTNADDGLGSLPEPPSNKEPKPPAKKQPSYQDLTKPLPNAKYEDNSNSDLMGSGTGSSGGGGTDYSSYLDGFSESTKQWTNVKNGQKYQKECVKTLDQSIYCLMLGEPDFRGALDIAAKTEKMVNLCRQSIGMQQIKLPSKPPTDIPSDNAGGKTNDWWGKP